MTGVLKNTIGEVALYAMLDPAGVSLPVGITGGGDVGFNTRPKLSISKAPVIV